MRAAFAPMLLLALLCGGGSGQAQPKCATENKCEPPSLEYRVGLYVPFYLLQQKCTALDATHGAQYAQALAKLFAQQQDVQHEMQHNPKFSAYVREVAAKLEERRAEDLQKDCARLLAGPQQPPQ